MKNSSFEDEPLWVSSDGSKSIVLDLWYQINLKPLIKDLDEILNIIYFNTVTASSNWYRSITKYKIKGVHYFGHAFIWPFVRRITYARNFASLVKQEGISTKETEG